MKNTTGPAQSGMQTLDPLYLFACRMRCLRLADQVAYEELRMATSHPNPDVRAIAEEFLDEIRAMQPQELVTAEGVCAG